MNKTIIVTIRDKIAVASKDIDYICGNSDFIVEFNFDEEWEEHTNKTARFSYNGTYQDVLFSGNKCSVPVISDVYSINVGVYAGNLCTTTPACVPAKKSILCGGSVPAAPSDDVYNRIMEKLNKIDRESVKRAVATSSDGKAYTATIEGVEKLDNEMELNIVFATTSATTSATLNVNGLGAKPIRVSSATSKGSYYPGSADYLSGGRMVKLFYDKNGNDGDGVWKAISFTRPIADNISGVVSVEHGGTGCSYLIEDYFLVGNGWNSVSTKSPQDVAVLLGAMGTLHEISGPGTAAYYDADAHKTSGVCDVEIMDSFDPWEKCHLPSRCGVLVVFAPTKDRIAQIFFDTVNTLLYFRTYQTEWSAWKKLSIV